MADSVEPSAVTEQTEPAAPAERVRYGPGLTSPHRLFGLADGVFAISMTLLALDIRIPDGVPSTSAAYSHASHAFYGNFGIFLLAFMIAGRFWLLNHHSMATLHTVDHGLLERTLSFLAGICSLPVATAVLFRFGSVPAAVSFASLLLAATSLLFARVTWYLTDPKRQLSDSDPKRRLPNLLGSLWNTSIFLLAIPAAYLLPSRPNHSHVAYAMLLWLLLLFDGAFGRAVMRLRERIR